MKTIDELRKGFEDTEAFKLYYSWQINFDEIANTYYSENSHLHDDSVALNAAWFMYKELSK